MKVLIIQQKMIGDVLTSSILFEAIKRERPNWELHYLINANTFPVVQNNPYIDNIIQLSSEVEKSAFKLFEFARSLKKEGYDLVLDAYSKSSSNLITFLSGAPKRISKHKWYTSGFYTQTIKYGLPPTISGSLAIDDRLRLLQPLEINVNVIEPRIHLTETEREEAKIFLRNGGLDLKNKIVMVSILGSSYEKTYPLEKMAELLDKLVEAYGPQLLFNYIPKQQSDAKKLYSYCATNTQNHIFLDVYAKDLRQFLAITSHCDAVIGNEGGAINMAKALGIPTFAIFSPWISKKAWAVFEESTQSDSIHLEETRPDLYKDQPLKQIRKNIEVYYNKLSVEDVWGKMKPFLNLQLTVASDQNRSK